MKTNSIPERRAVARDFASCTAPDSGGDLAHVLLTGGDIPPPAPAH